MADIRRWLPFRRGQQRNMTPRRGEAASAPASPMMQLQRDINRVFDQFLDEGLWRDPFGAMDRLENWFGDFSPAQFSPSLDVSDEGKSIKVTAELPGLKAEDIQLQVEDNALMLRGEKKLEQSDEDEGYYRTERSYGFFQRTVPLPADVDRERTEANFKDGILTVRLPKIEGKESSKRIEVKPS